MTAKAQTSSISWPFFGANKFARVRTPTVLQLEAAECGAASLAMVLSHYGLHVPLEELRQSCGVSRDGSKASNLLKAARALGLEAKGLRAEPQHLLKLKPPMIVFVNFNHFLVVEGIKHGQVYLNDPASGRRKVSMDEFDEMFTGVVLTFKPSPDFEKKDTRPSLANSLFERTYGFRSVVVFIFLVAFAMIIPGLILPIFSRVFIDEILIQDFDDWVMPLLLGMGLTALVRFVLLETQSWYLTRAETQLAIKGSQELFDHILRLPIPFFGARFAGEIAARLELNDGLAALLTGSVARAALNALMAVFFLLVMCAYNVKLALIVAIISLINILVVVVVSRTMSDHYQKLALDEGKLSGVELSGLQDIETFKAAGSENAFFTRWAGLQASLVNRAQEIGKIQITAGAVPGLLTMLSTAAILTIGGQEIIAGHMTIGMLIAFQTLSASFSGPIAELAGLSVSIQQVKSYAARIDDVLRQEPAVKETLVSAPPQSERLPRGIIEFHNVSFGYLPLEAPLIEALNISVKAGSQIALVGASGSGKSTIGRLMVDLYEPQQGKILLDGQPLAQWSRAVRAATMAYVDQEIILFEGSVRENLSLWDTTIPDHQLIQAARDAEIHDIIVRRPGGYNSIVKEEGRNFSGGQRQRLEIARALAVNPRILVLDEATSAMDPITEHRIMTNIKRRGCTLVIIAHRLSTIRDCDEIVVLDKGIPVERGRHADLMALAGRYSALVED